MKRLKAIWQLLTAKQYVIGTIKDGKWDIQTTFDTKDVVKSGNALYFH